MDSSHRSHNTSQLELDQSHSRGSAGVSPVPVPTPDPIASPPSMQSKPVPAPRSQGNPFLDEARDAPIPNGIVKKTSVKPAPRNQYRMPPELRFVKGHEIDSGSQVITAGSIQSRQATDVQFAR